MCGVLAALAIGLPVAVAGVAAPARSDTATAAPIVVFTSSGDAFSRYYAEILRAEGLNDFDLVDVGQLSAGSLADRAAVLLPPAALSDDQVTALTDWVEAGGNLIAFRPRRELAGLLGLGDVAGALADGYFKVDTTRPPGQGIAGDTMQFHGTADRWTVTGAAPVATLYTTAADASSDPAVTLRSVGSRGGEAAAFTFDVARSVVYTRQGNPRWAGQQRDFALDTTIRSDDLFFGAKPGDVQPDWVDLNKVRIPQADELQRLLANLITEMGADRLPVPRFWYLPRGAKAAVIMTGDDHGGGGTAGRFDRMLAASPPDCSVTAWTCPRATSYVVPTAPLTDAQVATYQAQGFEVALHLSTGCSNFTPTSLAAAWDTQLPSATAARPSMAPPRTNRTHCVAWSDWAGEPRAEAARGVRLDTNYYYWPGSWIQNRPGMFTGSGFPMRFADLDGTTIDVYQAATQLTDESDIDIPAHIRALLDGALGDDGYYGVFTANMHTDTANHPGANEILAAAQARGVPVVAARQMLDWLDGRNGSSFDGVRFADGRLTFTVTRAQGSDGLQGMLPGLGPSGPLTSLVRAGADVPTTARAVKGVDYEAFDAAPGDYVATYGAPNPTPTPAPEPTPSPEPTPLPEPSPEPSADPTPTSSPDPTPTFSPDPTPTSSPEPTPTGSLGTVPGPSPQASEPLDAATTSPRTIAIGPKRLRVGVAGVARLRLACAGCQAAPRVVVHLSWKGRDIASGRARLTRGSSTVALRLSAASRRRLVTRRSLTVIARARQGARVAGRATIRLTASGARP